MPGVTFNPLQRTLCRLAASSRRFHRSTFLPVFCQKSPIHCVSTISSTVHAVFQILAIRVQNNVAWIFQRSSPISAPIISMRLLVVLWNHLRTRVPHHDTGELYRNRPATRIFKARAITEDFHGFKLGLNSTTGVVELVRGEFLFLAFCEFFLAIGLVSSSSYKLLNKRRADFFSSRVRTRVRVNNYKINKLLPRTGFYKPELNERMSEVHLERSERLSFHFQVILPREVSIKIPHQPGRFITWKVWSKSTASLDLGSYGWQHPRTRSSHTLWRGVLDSTSRNTPTRQS